MGINQDFETSKSDHSILGSRLRFLMALLDRHPVQLLWSSNAWTMTFVWFRNLQSLLYLFQRLATGAMWKAHSEFLPAAPHVHICPYNQDGLHFIDLVQDFDAYLLIER